MRYFGALALEDFQDLLTPSKYKSYEKADISRASDDAVHEYNTRTPEMDRTATAIWEVMQLASEKAIKVIKQKDFQKYLTVANPRNGEEFFNQLEDSVVKQFNEILGDDLGDIDWTACGGIMKPNEYVESWRILLWDKAFQPFLNRAANPPYLKGSTFEDHPGTSLAEKRVLYRLDLAVQVVCHLLIARIPVWISSLSTFQRTSLCLAFHCHLQFHCGIPGLSAMCSLFSRLVMHICTMMAPFFFSTVTIGHSAPKWKKQRSSTTSDSPRIGGELMIFPSHLQSLHQACCTASGFSYLCVMNPSSHSSQLGRSVSSPMLVSMLSTLAPSSTLPPSKASSCEVLIKCFTKPGDIMLDWTASTDSTVYALYSSGYFQEVCKANPKPAPSKEAKTQLHCLALHPSPLKALTLPCYAETWPSFTQAFLLHLLPHLAAQSILMWNNSWMLRLRKGMLVKDIAFENPFYI